MTRYAFEVPGKPCAKARPRMTRNGRAYTPEKTVNAETAIRLTAQAQGVTPLKGPIEMRVVAVFPVAKSWTKSRREAALKGAPHVSRPDADNIGKLVGDALNGIAYDDDAQVYDCHVRKVYGPEPKTLVFIYDEEG